MPEGRVSPEVAVPAEGPRLPRVLGRWDLVLLFVVAIVNLNVVPTIAGNGAATLWLWVPALLLFFWPQGIAVIELAHRYPGEGGVYLWTKQIFGDFHGFLSGWCYWTNNVFYVPTVLLYFVGSAVFVAGAGAKAMGDDPRFALSASLLLLALLVGLNVVGLGVGKWVNNLGGIGTVATAAFLTGLGLVVWRQHGTQLALTDLRMPMDIRVVSAFGVMCFGLVGLELASVMGDEIKDPRSTLPGAVAWGGVLSGLLYVGATLTLLLAVPREKVGVLQGIMQAVTEMSHQAGIGWLVAPFALLLSVSIAGIASAWLSGSARIPFVAGLDRYLPAALGKLHPRYATPHVALLVHAGFSAAFLAVSFVGAEVKEAFVTLLDLAVVLQLVPFLYMYAALIQLSRKGSAGEGHYSKRTLLLAGISGFASTAIGMAVAFVPSHQITSIWLFELKMWLGTLFFIGLAGFFFFVYSRRRMAQGATRSV